MRNAIHDFFSNYGYDATNLGFPACNATNCINDQYTWTSGGIPTLNGLGSGAYLPEVGTYFNYIGSVNWNHGAHSVSTGIQIIRRQTNQAQSQAAYSAPIPTLGPTPNHPGATCLRTRP